MIQYLRHNRQINGRSDHFFTNNSVLQILRASQLFVRVVKFGAPRDAFKLNSKLDIIPRFPACAKLSAKAPLFQTANETEVH